MVKRNHNKSKTDKRTQPSIDIESIYALISREGWAELLDILYSNHKVVSTDPMFEGAMSVFENEFFREAVYDQANSKILRGFHLLHIGRMYKLSPKNHRIAVVEMVKLEDKADRLSEAYQIAQAYPDDEICNEVIQRYEASLPKVVHHSQESIIQVTESKNISVADFTTSLFKSPQEIDFFLAVREAFPSYVVYPNVAISCTIDFDMLKEKLSSQEKKYFFRAIIDCVVFDQHNNYKPLFFFELDSSYHDNDSQKQLDKMKDKLISLAGKKLFRIRRTAKLLGKDEFLKLVNEVFREESGN